MPSFESKLLSIGLAAQRLGVSIDTLRRWEKSGKFPSVRSAGGHRYFRSEDIENFLNDLFLLSTQWADSAEPFEPSAEYYCQTMDIFQARLSRFERALGAVPRLKDMFTLVSSVAGEIGNNSFDHNIGNWRDIPGVFFGYDVARGHVVLADRGQGVLQTLRRVKPALATHEEAVRVAFTEIISARAPQARGNGLKYVRRVVAEQAMTLVFISGSAQLTISGGKDELQFAPSDRAYGGCLVRLLF